MLKRSHNHFPDECKECWELVLEGKKLGFTRNDMINAFNAGAHSMTQTAENWLKEYKQRKP